MKNFKVKLILLPFVFLTIALFFTLNSLFANTKSTSLEYVLQRKDSTSLLITVSFKGNSTGKTLLHLPNVWASQEMLYKAVSMLHPKSKSTFIDTTSQPENYLVTYQPGRKVTIAYILKQGWAGPLRYPFYDRPIIRNNLFYFKGYNGLVYPDMDDQHNINCKLSYKGFSKEEFEGNSFFSNRNSGIFACTINDLMNSIFCAGSLRSKTLSIEGHQIVTAIYDKFPFTDDDAFSSISKIIREERKFWADPGSNYFLSLLIPTDDKGSNGGTAYNNSFSLFASGDVQLNNGILQTLSHEYFHTWIGSALKDPDPDEAYKWFKEGFTDYYSLKLLNKTGDLSNEAFIKKLNQDIRGYYLSPHFNADSLDMVGKYWTNEAWRQLPYRRGLTIAVTLDLKIQEKNPSLSLDDLMRELYGQSKPSLIFSTSLFDQLVLKYTSQETLDAVIAAIHGRNAMITDVLLSNKTYKTSQLAIHQVYDEGFDVAASTRQKKIIGLKPGSNAEKAGLKENMPFTGNVGFWTNNTEKPGQVQIVRDDKKEWISYMPVATVDLQVPQIIF